MNDSVSMNSSFVTSLLAVGIQKCLRADWHPATLLKALLISRTFLVKFLGLLMHNIIGPLLCVISNHLQIRMS